MAEHRILQLHQVLHPAARATAANTATPPAAPALTSVGIRLTAPALARHKHFTAADLPTEWHQQAGLVVGFFERNGFNRHGATVVGNKLGESFEVRAPAPAGGSLAGAGRARGRQRLCTGPSRPWGSAAAPPLLQMQHADATPGRVSARCWRTFSTTPATSSGRSSAAGRSPLHG